MATRRRAKRANFKVPPGIQSRNCKYQSYVHFKNLSDDVIDVYWIDYVGKPQFFAELRPINRSEQGLQFMTYVSHPFVAVYKRTKQCLFNGKRYFLPSPHVLQQSSINPRWTTTCVRENVIQHTSSLTQNNSCTTGEQPSSSVGADTDTPVGTLTEERNVREYMEVLILPPICMSLRTLCLIRSAQLFPSATDNKNLNIPACLIEDMELTRKKYFLSYSGKKVEAKSSVST